MSKTDHPRTPRTNEKAWLNDYAWRWKREPHRPLVSRPTEVKAAIQDQIVAWLDPEVSAIEVVEFDTCDDAWDDAWDAWDDEDDEDDEDVEFGGAWDAWDAAWAAVQDAGTPWPRPISVTEAFDVFGGGDFLVEGPRTARVEPPKGEHYLRVHELARMMGLDNATMVTALRLSGEYVLDGRSWVAKGAPMVRRLLDCAHHVDLPARVGKQAVWECQSCGRYERMDSFITL